MSQTTIARAVRRSSLASFSVPATTSSSPPPTFSTMVPTTTTKIFLSSFSSLSATKLNTPNLVANPGPSSSSPSCRYYYCRHRNFSTAATTRTGGHSHDNDNNDNNDYDHYHVEVSNLYGNRNNYTQIVITGKGVPGLLASICTAITIQGGSIKELHAAEDMKEGGFTPTSDDGDEHIRDIIYVVDRSTGQSFHDDDLEELAYKVLQYTSNPMAIVQAVCEETEKQLLEIGTTSRRKGGGNVTILPAHKFPSL